MYGIISCSVLGQRAMLGTGEVRLRSDVCGMCTETFQKTGEQQAAGSGMGGPGPGPGPRELASLEVALWTWHTTCEKVSMTRPKKKKNWLPAAEVCLQGVADASNGQKSSGRLCICTP